MKTTIECQGFSISNAIDSHARSQLADALRHFADDVRALDIYMRDVSGPHGPKEYNVVASVALDNAPRVVVEGNGCELYVTVRYVAQRAKRAVERAVRRRRAHTSDSVRRLNVAEDELAAPIDVLTRALSS